MNERYYKHSGSIPIGGLLTAIMAGVVSSALLGYLYGVISYYNPFIYINFLGALGVGFLPAVLIGMAAKHGKIRNQPVLTFVGILTGLVALYFSWAGYVLVVLASSEEIDIDFETAVNITSNPLVVFEIAKAISHTGVWSMASFTPTGAVLFVLWLVEAGIIVLMNVFSAGCPEEPYCEGCGIWTEMKDDVPILTKTDVGELKKNLEQENYDILDEMLKDEADPTDCFTAIFHVCPQCDDSTYLSIYHVTVTLNKENEAESNAEDVIKTLVVPSTLVDLFLGKAKALQQLREQEELEKEQRAEDQAEVSELDDEQANEDDEQADTSSD